MSRSSCCPAALPKPRRCCASWPRCSSSNMRSSDGKPGGLRIVGGAQRGRRLVAPSGEAVRPTSDRAREALFNILSHGRFAAAGLPFAGRPVVDAFAGTGAFGLEALSRGAAVAAFIENDPAALAALRHNIAALGAEDR